MVAPNVFQALLPYPNEDDFTSALVYLIDPKRPYGPEVLSHLLSLIPGFSKGFDSADYAISKQRTAASGRFDILIRSPGVNPKVQIVVENKVELSVDDRSVESIRKYLEWLRGYASVANYLVLNTKYSIPDGTEIPQDVVVTHWHMVAKEVREFLGELPSHETDDTSKDFLEFLEAHDMGPLDKLTFQDGVAFRDFRTTKIKFDYILDSIGSRFRALGYKVGRTVELDYEEPYYGIVLRKGEDFELFDNEVYFMDKKDGESRSLIFAVQTFLEKKFYDFVVSRYSDLLGDITKGSRITFDERYYWTISKNLEEANYADLEEEKDDLLKFSIEGLKAYQEKLLPLLEKAAKQYKY